MSSANVLPPSAPPEASPLYPQLQPNFWLQKINEISTALNNEVAHYRVVVKKYKQAKKFVNWSIAGSSVLSAVFSSASLGSALSVVGLPATTPSGGVGRCFALALSGLILASKKIDSKIKKHPEIVTLAIAKHEIVEQLLSKTLADNQVSDAEFQLIMTEFSQYYVLKEAVRAKLTLQLSCLDVEKIKKNLHSKIETEFRKKILAIGSN